MHVPQQKSLIWGLLLQCIPFTMYICIKFYTVHACYMQRSLAKISSHPPCVRLWEGAAQYLTESGRKAARLNKLVLFSVLHFNNPFSFTQLMCMWHSFNSKMILLLPNQFKIRQDLILMSSSIQYSHLSLPMWSMSIDWELKTARCLLFGSGSNNSEGNCCLFSANGTPDYSTFQGDRMY